MLQYGELYKKKGNTDSTQKKEEKNVAEITITK